MTRRLISTRLEVDGAPRILEVRESGPEDAHLPQYDFTTLTAVNTCPAWGIVRYIHSRAVGSGGRSMALEAGSACHRVFAAERIWHLMHEQKLPAHALHHGPAMFGKEAFAQMLDYAGATRDPTTARLNFCLEALMTSGFYDDPRDRRRTMTNLEEACIAYIDRTDACRRAVWISDGATSTSPVGIEVGFDVRVACGGYDLPFRFVGRVDGIHRDNETGEIVVQENKTSSRLDDAWRESFIMSHQTTGYCIGVAPLVGTLPCTTKVHGLAIPLPKSYDAGGVVSETYPRHDHQFLEWFKWARATSDIIDAYRERPHTAPQYTHSCNRYFRPCSMIPYCSATPQDRQDMLTELNYEPWNPLHDGGNVNE